MAAPRDDHGLGRAAASRRSAGAIVRPLARVALSMLAAAGLIVAGCGQSMQVELPDLATASPKSEANKSLMSGADQKKAIDAMIAKRERHEREAREAEGK